MVLLGKIALGLTGTMLAGIGAICSGGVIEVNVVERSPEVHHVYVLAPAMLVPIATHFIPRDKLGDASEQLKPYLPEIRAALGQLREEEDFVLVDVKEREQHVEVQKIGGSLVIDVHDPNETVHVETPIRAIASTIEQLADSHGETTQ
ncbi:MAG TPA: hypothetical protein VGD60_16320 [Candidatus Acidoferrales bacterium]